MAFCNITKTCNRVSPNRPLKYNNNMSSCANSASICRVFAPYRLLITQLTVTTCSACSLGCYIHVCAMCTLTSVSYHVLTLLT